ncbi:MAG: DUF2953 domain-containing protein [Clostridia bacterium]|nr:DUF2953 domain-containing protein [Clostridia bacterium]
MTALYIILGIILFLVLIFCVKISVELIYDKSFAVTLKVLFIKIPLLPSSEKKKKPKKEKTKKEKPKKEPAKEQTPATAPDPNAPKKENFVMKFYHNQGFDGTVVFIKDVLRVLNTFLGDIFRRSFTIEKLFLRMRVSKGDAAETAIAYGKTCAAVFPAMAHICATMRVRKYDIEISPDYLASKSTSAIRAELSVRPIRITNAAVKLAFKAVLAFLRANKRGKERQKALAQQNTNSDPVNNTEERNTK